MKVLIAFILSVSVPLGIGAAATGFYPVALVGSSPIFQRTWHKSEEAAKKFTNANLQSSGGQPLDFNAAKNANFLLEIRRGALMFLIEDEILKSEGENIIDGFDTLSRQRVFDSKREMNNGELAKAAKLVYGLSEKEFESLVLMPQARRDVIAEILAEKRQNFDSWLGETKKSKHVRLFFVPFTWDGEAVR